MTECNEQGSWQGQCCCNCKWQKPVSLHPWNKPPFKGSIMDTFGFVCFVPDLKNAIFSDRKHGMCKVWTPKETSDE